MKALFKTTDIFVVLLIFDDGMSGRYSSKSSVPLGTGYRENFRSLVPLGSGYRGNFRSRYRRVPGTDQISIHADPGLNKKLTV